MNPARAILWAQWRTFRNYPSLGTSWALVIGTVWYGGWLVAAFAVARVLANPEELGLIRLTLPGGLVLVFLYWQVAPLLVAATGASLDLRKLQAYPIPTRQLFGIEVLLRTTAAVEMLFVLLSAGIGILLNPRLPKLGVVAILLFILFNLFLAVGLRDLVARLLAHKRVREIAFMLLVLGVALPQLFIARGARFFGIARLLVQGDSWGGWPWTATAHLVLSPDAGLALIDMSAWCGLAATFGLWQFTRTLSFDAEAAGATRVRPPGRPGVLERFYQLPALLFRDPLGALIEKEVRFLTRSPRFRLVFLMGFTFGVIVLLPATLGRNNSGPAFFRDNYLTVVSVYSLLLLSEVCFWNSFGFDRSAAQVYFLAPVSFARVLISKNLSAVLFIVLEILGVTAVCSVVGMPFAMRKFEEAFAVAAVISIFLLGAGNMMSVRQARGVNPDSSFRRGAAGRVQAILFVVYPIAFIPAALAYLARYAFESEAAFFGVLALDAAAGMVFYRIALESAVGSAESQKEKLLASLAAGDGPIAG